jgi:peroxiredoxin
MKVFYALGVAIFLISCSKPQNPDELFLAAKERLYKAARVEFRQTLIFEIPNMGEFDTTLYSVDFRKNPVAVLGYDFKGEREGHEFWYVEGVQYNVDHLKSTILTLEENESERLKSNSYRSFNPIGLLENEPWKYVGDTSVEGQQLLQFLWIEMDTIIMDKKVYLENHLWINPANLLPEFYSRRLYHDGRRNQLIESTFENWKLEEKAEPFVVEFPKGYLTKVEGSTESPLLKVGVQAPDFELEDADGKAVKLSDFRGKKVLLDFSMINCGWCKIALEQFAKPDYEFAESIVPLYVNPVDSKERMGKYMSNVEIPFTVLLDAKEVGKSYGVSGFPTFYLIDENGKIEEVSQGYSDEGILKWKRNSE